MTDQDWFDTDHAAKHGGKAWKYLLLPHDAIAENMSIKGLAAQFAMSYNTLGRHLTLALMTQGALLGELRAPAGSSGRSGQPRRGRR